MIRKPNRKKSDLQIKIAIAVFLVFLFFFAAIFNYINNSRVQSIIYASINKISSLNIESAKLNLNLFKRTINIKALNLYNPGKKQRFTADELSFRFKLYPLLKASINIDHLEIKNLHVDIGERIKKKKAVRPKIGLTNLLIVKNVTIKKGTITSFQVSSPKTKTAIERFDINYLPGLWGDIDLTIKISGIQHESSSKPPWTAEEVVVKGATDVNKWIDLFPYVDDLHGKIDAKKIVWQNLNIESASAKLDYSEKKIGLSPLTATLGGNSLEINGLINANSEEYKLSIKMPEAIYLPAFGRESSFLDTSGYLKGDVNINGKGLDYKNTTADATVDISHTLAKGEPLPANLNSQIKIAGGTISLAQATLKVGDNNVNVKGAFNYLKPHLDLSFDGEKIPAETVMNRFRTKHYHPTRGLAKVSGHFSGWKPDFKFHLSVDASPASYYEMVVDRVKMEMDLTYNTLDLNGSIFENGTETGKVNLKMHMGGKLPDATRQKTFELVASVTNHDLKKTMEAYGLSGIGTGTITLKGSPKAYSGTGKALIENGDLKGINFLKAQSDIKFVTKKVTFENMRLSFSETGPSGFPNPLVMDVTDYGVYLHGTPRTGLSIDSKYTSSNGAWQINKISYASLTRPDWETILSGTVRKDGGLSLRLNGTFDSSLLAYFRGYVRDTNGPLLLQNMSIGGTTKNPIANGEIVLKDNTAALRGFGYYVDKINGSLKFAGNTINIPKLTGRIEYGDFTLSGLINHHNMEVSQTKLNFKGNSIRYGTIDRAFRMEFDCDLNLDGNANSSLLAGNVSILDGRYTKNFSIFEKMKTKKTYKEEKMKESEWKNMRLDLKVRSHGDLKIDNNLGEIWLETDLLIKGSRAKPEVIGNIETVGGEINYAGLNFEVTRGFIEYRDPYTNPYMEFDASKEVGDYNVTLTVRGQMDKLYLDLESTPPLEQNDILALLTYGVTEDEIEDARFGYQIGTGIAAEQVGALLQGPIRKFTPVDRFKVEVSPRDTDITRVNLGKDVSDRMRVNLITDVSTADAVQTFEAEYSITDFLLLKGSGSTDANYRVNMTFRFRER